MTLKELRKKWLRDKEVVRQYYLTEEEFKDFEKSIDAHLTPQQREGLGKLFEEEIKEARKQTPEPFNFGEEDD